jgi:hypothetical protein
MGYGYQLIGPNIRIYASIAHTLYSLLQNTLFSSPLQRHLAFGGFGLVCGGDGVEFGRIKD